uniref:ACP S-malonyltransferase n=1 Tax=Globicatella sulfidifaciens TaxID=136093 RepID=UPI0023F1E7C7|nr:ACP S-malonyltransferase [Globicatella sulfidifaciens]
MKLAVMFNGQGAHFEQMGQDFVTHFEEARAVYQRAEQLTQLPITKWITEDISALNFTKNAQLAISTTSLAIFNSIKKHLPDIEAMGGLSLGEYSALIASQILSEDDAWPLLKKRGELMSAQTQTFTHSQMVAVIQVPLDKIKAIINEMQNDTEIYIANYNAPTQIVLGGTQLAIKEFKQLAKAKGYKKILPLKVEGPFHTPLMKKVQEPFKEALSAIAELETKGKVPVWSNVTAEPHQATTIKPLLVDHLVKPVKWLQTIDQWHQQGITHIIQIGPGNTLAKLLNQQYPTINHLVVNKVEDIENISAFLKS